MTSRLYVFAPLSRLPEVPLSPDHTLAGRVEWVEGAGEFVYAPDWLSDPRAYSLDPENLPLRDGPFRTRANEGVHGVLADAGPDAWGRKLIELHRGEKPTPLDALRLTNGTGTGALLFSQSRTRPAPRRALTTEATLEELEAAAREVAAGEQVSNADLERIFLAGSSLGGARPKVNVDTDGRKWIAKFQSPSDDINNPRLEFACLQLGALAGLEVPDHRLIDLNGRTALLVERFDRPQGGHLHYISLHALLSMERVRAEDTRGPLGRLTYGSLAATCRRMGVANAGPIMFRRMMFNLRIGNTDDHLRNHGLLFNGTWRHAPSFDLVSLGGQQQAVGIGTDGRISTLENAFSDVARFSISLAEATEIDNNVCTALAGAGDLLAQVGLPKADTERVLRRMRREKQVSHT